MSLMERKRQIVYMGKSKRTKHAHEAPAPEDIVVDEGGPYRLSDGSLCVSGCGFRGTLGYME
jgi:hypothetical protein